MNCRLSSHGRQRRHLVLLERVIRATRGTARRPSAAAVAASALLAFASVARFATATFPSTNWSQVNQNGFIAGPGPSADGSELFTFDSRLYALNFFGLFRMDDPATKTWSQVLMPAQPGGPGTTPSKMIPIGGYLYAWDDYHLWWIATGADLTGSGWTAVNSTGLPGGPAPIPMTTFNGAIYGVSNPGGLGPFEIWRTPDVGSASATWTRVVQNSFGDPTNNRGVDVMITFNGRVYAGTTTLGGVFGAPESYGTGVEIWESTSGNDGTWSQVNVDGFGTMLPTPPCYSPTLCTFPIHQVIGSAAVYQPSGAPQSYLYIGTKSHFGAEVWRYDGTGVTGWTNVTPPWAGPCLFGCGPGRDDALTVFQGELWLGEGFPTGNLSFYDGSTWTIEVSGPAPFDPANAGVVSLAVLEGRLYGSTIHTPGGTQGDQVWRYTYSPASVTATKTISPPAGTGYMVGETVTYVVVLTNGGSYPQLDNPGDEFTDTLPPELFLVSATATSGTVSSAGNTVHWNGEIASGASVTITIQATIAPGSWRHTFVNQGTVLTDVDGDAINETTRGTDDPSTAAAGDGTSALVSVEVPIGSTATLALLALALLAGGAWVLRRS